MTGIKLSDDWKEVIFQDINHLSELGRKYYWDSNYWLCVNPERLKTLTANSQVRRCTVMMRWLDDDGNYYEEPAIFDYKIARSKDSLGTDSIITPEGYLDLIFQLNDQTRTIHPNQRFIFGDVANRTCWKIAGRGMQTLNQQTGDDTSGNLVTTTVVGWPIDPDLDNLTLGIANYNKDSYSMAMSPTSITGNPTDTYQLNVDLTKDRKSTRLNSSHH
jgi:hypothetical protein